MLLTSWVSIKMNELGNLPQVLAKEKRFKVTQLLIESLTVQIQLFLTFTQLKTNQLTYCVCRINVDWWITHN